MVARTSADPRVVASTLFEARSIYDRMQRKGLFRGDTRFERMAPGLERLVKTCLASAR